jgi:hypothetical protein
MALNYYEKASKSKSILGVSMVAGIPISLIKK